MSIAVSNIILLRVVISILFLLYPLFLTYAVRDDLQLVLCEQQVGESQKAV